MTIEEYNKYISSPNASRSTEDIVNGLQVASSCSLTKDVKEFIEAAISKLLIVEKHAHEWKAMHDQLQNMHDYQSKFRQQLEKENSALRHIIMSR